MLRCNGVAAVARLSVAGVLTICAGAQDLPSIPVLAPGVSAMQPGAFGSEKTFTMAVTGTAAAVSGSATAPEPARPPRRPRRITLEQVKQSAKTAINPLQRLSALSVEAAKQHRLGVQADYFPKFSATFWNLFDFGKREHAVKEARAQLENGRDWPASRKNQELSRTAEIVL